MIYFKTLRYKNLLSTGNEFVEIDLTRNKTTLVIGDNGAGKSTMLDALSFVLYGKPYRNINKPGLLNSITNKNLVVEVEFEIGKRKYIVRRGIKPNIFEIYVNGEMLEQNAAIRDYQSYLESHILKLNHKAFTQIVIVGSANFTPFMQLKPQQRREVNEDLLDIQIFSKMFMLVKEKQAVNKTDITAANYKINIIEEKINMTNKHIKKLKELKQKDIIRKQKKIDVLNERITESQATVDRINQEIIDEQATITDKNAIESKIVSLIKYEAQFNNKIKNITNDINFYNNNDDCPTCKQPLEETFKIKSIKNKQNNFTEIETAMSQLNVAMKEANDRLKEITAVQDRITNKQQELSTEQSVQKVYLTNLNILLTEIENTDYSGAEHYESTLKKQQKSLKAANKEKENLINEKELLMMAYSLLKDDGIKSKIIKQYIPIINKLINKYLAAMDFFIQFTLDEQFNETILSRFRDEFTYSSFSEGEKARIDLALIMTWRAVAKLRNSASSNLLIMDEVFDGSLDNQGSEEFLKILNELTGDSNVFVISHKGTSCLISLETYYVLPRQKTFQE